MQNAVNAVKKYKVKALFSEPGVDNKFNQPLERLELTLRPLDFLETGGTEVEALRQTDAYDLQHQAIGTLSGGELKRVLLAYCLVMPQKLLVLDEGFADVDVQGSADFYALLNELKREEGWTYCKFLMIFIW